MHIAYHLGVSHCGFESGIFYKNLMENLDETHFTINMDIGRTPDFQNDTFIKYANVVAGGEAMTMVV